MPTAVKVIAGLLVLYVLLVAAFETWLGVSQPQSGSSIVITTIDPDGDHDRVVRRLESGGKLYVAVNHWPRAWYYRLLDNPNVKVTIDGERGDYLATQVEGAERDQLLAKYPSGWMFRIMTGFPPRHFIRLDHAGS